MLFENLGSFFAETVSWLALNEPVDEVSGLDRPASRNLVLVDLDLF